MAYFSWSHSGINPFVAPYEACSPNLSALMAYLKSHWSGFSLGCHLNRNIEGTSSYSTHAYGAALDVSFSTDVNRLYAAAFMMDHFDQLGLNAIHDYRRQMIFKDDHLWHPASIGSLGGSWFHVEVKPDRFMDGRSVDEKLGSPPPPPPSTPPPPPSGGFPPYNPWLHQYSLWPLNTQKPTLVFGSGYAPGTQGDQGACTYFNHVAIFEGNQGSQPGGYLLPYQVFTQSSVLAVRNLNAFFNRDGSNRGMAEEAWRGQCGPEMWKLIDALATNFGRPR